MKVIRIASCNDCPFLTYVSPVKRMCTKQIRYVSEEECKGIPKDCPLEDEKKKEPRWACGSFNEADF